MSIAQWIAETLNEDWFLIIVGLCGLAATVMGVLGSAFAIYCAHIDSVRIDLE